MTSPAQTDFRGPYQALNRFAAVARGRAALWQTGLGLVLALGIGFGVMQGILWLVTRVLGPDEGQRVLARFAAGDTPISVVILLLTYVPLAAGLALALALVHRRGLSGLIGPWPLALRHFLRVCLPLLLFWLLLTPVTLMSSDATPNLSLMQQLPWLPLALAGLLVQTGTEELIFRGYLLQQMAARSTARLVWMVIPSVIFGMAHYAPQHFGVMAWAVVAWSALFGIAAADLTARTGTLGAAVGLHLANNASAILLVGVQDSVSGLALYTTSLDPLDIDASVINLAANGVTLLIGWVSARLLLRV